MGMCHGKTKLGDHCKAQALLGSLYCRSHQEQDMGEPVPSLNDAEIADRMVRPSAPRIGRMHNCPECGARPIVCTMKRSGGAAYRCRVCGARWGTGDVETLTTRG